MAWVGIEYTVRDEIIESLLKRLGLKIVRKLDAPIHVKTSRGWIKFKVYDLLGEAEGIGDILAREAGHATLEAGRHLILGETSARLWDEAVKIVFPDGYNEVIPVFTCDGFLDVKMPTQNIKGVNATMIIKGKLYKLPLSLEDLTEIYYMGKDFIEKVEKAASVYGLEKIISKEALEALRKARKAPRVEVDYDAMLVFIFEGSKMKTASLQRYFLELIYSNKLEEAKKMFQNAPKNVKDVLVNLLREEYEVLKMTSDREKIENMKRFMEDNSIPV